MFVIIPMQLERLYVCAILCHLPALFKDSVHNDEPCLLILDPSSFSRLTPATMLGLKALIVDTSKYPGASRLLNATALKDIQVRYPQVRLSGLDSRSRHGSTHFAFLAACASPSL